MKAACSCTPVDVVTAKLLSSFEVIENLALVVLLGYSYMTEIVQGRKIIVFLS